MDRLNEAWEIVVEVTYRLPTDMVHIEIFSPTQRRHTRNRQSNSSLSWLKYFKMHQSTQGAPSKRPGNCLKHLHKSLQ